MLSAQDHGTDLCGVASIPNATECDDAALLVRLRAGDAAAFEEVVNQNCPRLLAVAHRMLGCPHEAADAVQDGLISAHRAIDRFEGTSRLSTWLHRIVVNASLMRLRSRRRRTEVAIDGLLPSFAPDGHRVVERRAWNASPESMLESEDARHCVRAAIDRLPEEYRTVLMLRDIELLDTGAAAEVLGISHGAVKTRLHRARMALREILEQRFGGA